MKGHQLANPRWHRSQEVSLTDLFAVGTKLHNKLLVTPDITTNRTGRPNADILCTPGLINTIANLTTGAVNASTPRLWHGITKSVKIYHRRPLPIGKEFDINAEVKEVKPSEIKFSVTVESESLDRPLADGEICIKAIKAY